MSNKLSKIVGIKKEEFDALVRAKEINLRRARLIPTTKIGDEITLSSVFLDSLRLIKEFRETILADIKMNKGGYFFVYTEVEFPKFQKARVDGLILVVKGGIIKDAAIIEVKSGADILKKEQIDKYTTIATELDIPRIVTISNEFVSNPTQSPLHLKNTKSTSYYHLPWAYILTQGHILLFEKTDHNIEDVDQVNIMEEVIDYLEYPKSGVCGFNQMKKGWSETIDKINLGAALKEDEQSTIETVESWQQEERDLALMLSRELGVLVKSGKSKFKDDLGKRIKENTKELISCNHLESTFRIPNTVSDLKITALLEKRNVMMSVTFTAPSDKSLKGQVSWLIRQLDSCKKKSSKTFEELASELYIEVNIKNSSRPELISHQDLDDLTTKIKGKEIKAFRVIYSKDFGKQMSSRTKFIETIESMAIRFYYGVVQNLKKWEPMAPRMKSVEIEKDETEIENPLKQDDFHNSENLTTSPAIVSVSSIDDTINKNSDKR